jgi:NagD protein
MDGVIYQGDRLIPGAKVFVDRLIEGNHRFLFLTNNSQRTPLDLQRKLDSLGIEVGTDHFYTSALATAAFLHGQRPGGTAYVIGDAGLTHALYEVGYSITDQNPDYVVLGTTRSYDFQRMEKAVNLIRAGALFIATNPDLTGPVTGGIAPACGSLAAPIRLATGKRPYFVGKPNPLMMRMALRRLGDHSENTLMVGDNMDTDIITGTETGMKTILVLSGVTSRSEVDLYAFHPNYIYQDVGEIPVDQL